jgi:opacity protein-like surface antigen
MKTRLLLVVLAVFVTTPASFSQFVFGVSPGIGFNSAYFGFRSNNKIVPYFGIQYLNGKYKYEENGQRYDYDLSRIVTYSDKEEFSGNLIIPDIGVKYFIKQHDKLQAYLSLNITKPLITGKLKTDGVEDQDFNDAIKSLNKSMWGYEFGFGVEYFVDENFSIGGEFGLRHLHVGYSDSHAEEIYNPSTGNYVSVEIKNNIKLNGSPTFSKISLNYYF